MEVAVTPQQEVGARGVPCPAWTDIMAHIIINYSWHLILPMSRVGAGGQCQGALCSKWPGVHMEKVIGCAVSSVQTKRPSKEIPGIPLLFQLGQQVTLQLITKLERLGSRQTTDRPK